MKKFLKFLSFLLCFSLLIIPIRANAHKHSSYSHDSNVGLSKPNWMSGLSDDTLINRLSIPGTNQSMAYGDHTDFTLTQSMDLKTQLESGIRYIDIWVKNTEQNKFEVYKEGISLGHSLSDVVKTIGEFLDKHRDETVLLKVTQSGDSAGNFAYQVQTVLEKDKLDHYIFDGSKTTNPRLGDARGQIILLADYETKGRRWKTIPYEENASIQADNYLATNWDLYSKWQKVKNQLYQTSNSPNPSIRYENNIAGQGGALPYFVASGHVSSGTDANRLSTGLTTPGFNSYYPDFPRVNRLGIFSTIAFEGTNTLTFDYIVDNDVKFCGVILANFPGAGLIEEIINVNFKTNNSSSSNGSGSGSSGGSSSGSTSNTDGWGFTFINS